MDVGTASFIHSDVQPTRTNRPPQKSVVAALQDVTLYFLFAVTDYVLTLPWVVPFLGGPSLQGLGSTSETLLESQPSGCWSKVYKHLIISGVPLFQNSLPFRNHLTS